MQHQKTAARGVSIFPIEAPDQLSGQQHQGMRVAIHRLFHGVGKVRQQRIADIRILIGKAAHFQLFHQIAHLPLVQQKRRDGHQRFTVRRNAFGKIELRQCLRLQNSADGVVHQFHCKLREGQQQKQKRDSKTSKRIVERDQRQDDYSHCKQGDGLNSAKIKIVGIIAKQNADTVQQAGTEPAAGPQVTPPGIDQIIADMRTARGNARIYVWLLGCILGHFQRHLRNFDFVHRRPCSKFFNGCSIHVAAVEVHVFVGVGWILLENGLERNKRFQDVRPGRQSYLLQAQNGSVKGCVARWQVAECAGSLGQNFFQQHLFQRDRQRPQLPHRQRFLHLKPLKKTGEYRNAPSILRCV